MKQFVRQWWLGLKYAPNDPRAMTGRAIKIVAIGGGTGLSNLLRGLRQYSDDISAVVTVADNGASTGVLRKEFDILAPGDIRRCIAALSYNEELITDLFNYRFDKEKLFGGHTLGNIWLTALSNYFGSFDKAVEVTSELFNTAGRVLPASLDNVDLRIKYEDGTEIIGEHNLDEIVKQPQGVSFTKREVAAHPKAIEAIVEADLIIIGPGSLFASIIPNLIIPEIRGALLSNNRATKVYVANCSTERTQTADFSIEDHINVILDHTKDQVFDYCLVNNKILRQSKKRKELGEINNITTDQKVINGVEVVLADVISSENPLFHDSTKLAKALLDLYNRVGRS